MTVDNSANRPRGIDAIGRHGANGRSLSLMPDQKVIAQTDGIEPTLDPLLEAEGPRSRVGRKPAHETDALEGRDHRVTREGKPAIHYRTQATQRPTTASTLKAVHQTTYMREIHTPSRQQTPYTHSHLQSLQPVEPTHSPPTPGPALPRKERVNTIVPESARRRRAVANP